MQIVTIYGTERAATYESSGKIKVATDRCQQDRIGPTTVLLETSEVLNERPIAVHPYIYPRYVTRKTSRSRSEKA